MHQTLAEALGREAADVLMEHLPPSGWGDIARRADLNHVESVLRLELQSLESRLDARFAGLDAKLSERMVVQTRTIMVGIGGMVVALVGAMTGAIVTLAR
jgi:hypothetical protein